MADAVTQGGKRRSLLDAWSGGERPAHVECLTVSDSRGVQKQRPDSADGAMRKAVPSDPPPVRAPTKAGSRTLGLGPDKLWFQS